MFLNGNITGNGTLEGSVMKYNCNGGYIIQGTNISICSDQGIWEPDPDAVMCRGKQIVHIAAA